MSATRFRALPFGLRFALRDLLGDSRGFAIFIACIVIGVAAISGVSGLSRSLTEGLAREGRTILGGDASFSLVSRELTPEQRAFFQARGRISEITTMRAMARREDGQGEAGQGASGEAELGEAAMVEIKAVDVATYPARGVVDLEPDTPLAETLGERDGVAGIVVDPILLARLDARLGDIIFIGDARFQLRAKLRHEPDSLAGGVAFGPRVMMTRAALQTTGIVTPGSVYRNVARVTLADASDEEVKAFAKAADDVFPQAGWEKRTRDAVSPQFSRNLDRFAQLLTLVALTALMAGGVGVANAVQGFVERKRAQFAILKALGATGSRVFAIALFQVLAAAALAIVIGLAIGAVIPYVAAATLRELADLPVSAALDLRGAFFGALYGLLIVLIFALVPLGRAHETPVAALLRDDPRSGNLTRFRIGAALATIALAAHVVATSSDLKFGASYVAAAALAFALLRGAAWLMMRAVRALPRFSDARLRLALANIARPKSLAPALIISIGLTQTLLVALVLVEGAIHQELARADAGEIPNFFFVDTPKAQARNFANFLKEQAPANARIEHVPMMRGRMVEVKGVPVGKVAVADDQKWAFEGDRGITFSDRIPTNSTLGEGEWWPSDYKGPPLVSLEQKVAEGIGVSVGDDVKVNVLGRDVVAKVANLRKVDWRSYAINFIMVFSPNVFSNAPYTELFTVAYGAPNVAARDATDAKLARETAKRFPMIVSVRVKDALAAIDKIAGQLALAARVAAGLAIVTAVLALASALAAGQRARLHDAVVLKTLGATRGWLAAAYAMEFGLVGIVASLIALAAGAGAAYAMVALVMKIDFAFSPVSIGVTTLAALAAVIALGLAGTWRVLSKSPGQELREL